MPSIEAKGILGQVLTQVFRFQPAVGSESVRTSSFDISRRASTWESNRTLGKITGTLPISMKNLTAELLRRLRRSLKTETLI